MFFLLRQGAGGARLPLGDWVGGLLAIPMLALGFVLLIGTRLMPGNWVFVCPRGVVRTRGDAWDSVGWDEVERFEDATLGHRGVTFRQCRLVLKDGREWGFLADHIAEYRRLSELLRQKLAARGAEGGTSS
jgi:hypothetical protein